MSSLFIYDWSFYNNEDSENNELRIDVFGINKNNETVVLHVKDFKPYVYVEIPDVLFQYVDKHVQKISDQLVKYLEHKPIKIQLVYKKKLYYVHKNKNNEDMIFPYFKYYFHNRDHCKEVQKSCYSARDIWINGHKFSKIQFKIHENNSSPILQLCVNQQIPVCGWTTFTGGKLVDNKYKQVCTLHEYNISYKSLQNYSDCLDIVNPVCLSFDIEVYSTNPNAMPNAKKNYGDCVFQISVVLWNQGMSNISTYLFSLGNPSIDKFSKNDIVYTFPSEELMLQAFSEFIVKTNPHIITGYNILGFDIPYLIDRAELKHVSCIFLTGMLTNKYCSKKEEKWASSAYGQQHFTYLNWDGRIVFDMLNYMRRDHKFSNYKLDTVAETLLGANKDPLTAKDIFEAYREGMNGSDRGNDLLGVCGAYCIKDALLVQQLFDYCDIWTIITELSNICYVQCELLYLKGQQLRVFSQIYKYCFDNNIVVEQNAYIASENEEYQGADVLSPRPGIYKYVVPMDFSSLYPSIIVAFNIDYSTYVDDENTPMYRDIIPDENCHVIEWSNHKHCVHDLIHNPDSKEYECQEYRYRFLKENQGILPTMIMYLLNARKNVKKLLKSEQNKAKKNILDKRQLSLKICANSMYGSMGVHKGYLPFMIGAMCVTAMGRLNVKKAAEYLEKNYEAKITYGDTDSVYCQFPSVSPDNLWQYALRIEKELIERRVFPSPMELLFERKIYNPFLILTKKRYMYKEITEGNVSCDKIGKKGVLLARRDNCAWVRNVYEKIVMMIFDEATIEELYDTIVDEFSNCCGKNVTIDDFIITSKVGDENDYKVRALPNDPAKREKRLKELKCTEIEYKERALPAHVQLARKMRCRGHRVDIGQRIEYVVTNLGGYKAKNFDKIEDPEFVQKYQGLIKIDTLYYLHRLIEPLDQLLSIFVKDCEFTKKHYKLREKKRKMLDELLKLFVRKIELIS